MFRKIRERITLFNTLILICFLVLFIAGLIFFIKGALGMAGRSYLKEIAADFGEGGDGIPEDSENSFHGQIGFDYIIWNPGAGVAVQSTNNAQLVEGAHALLDKQPGTEGVFGTVRLSDATYRVFSEYYDYEGKEQILQIIQDVTAENEIVGYLIECLLIIGALGLLCLVPISYFLAGKSLVPIKNSYESQKKFIADASHELRSPLTVMRTNIDVLELKSSETIEENMKWLNNISMECDSMTNLVSEMFLIAQADSGQLRFEEESVSLSDIAEDVFSLMEMPAEAKDIELDAAIEPDITYVGDEDKFRQLMRIFVDNAIKYTPADGEVVLELSKDPNNVSIKVSDTGMGIPKEDQEKIFERFYRCDEARQRGAGGSGLGLNIAQSIVSHYGGRISTESEPGSGTIFTVLLPVMDGSLNKRGESV